ncbi:hypothetical protein [Deinococcus knuensis]|uniref:Uncharacterized protein n=1 Tax=Deinococcus knuensis TaxID=1837380 RepID=A0ABQ2SD95_9DEIO|nr:hypothetical protein [Deinococcus knuensis]GGS14408.1 hypothetical protein GCM10008961_02060 [Deinococcus knuensis]
MAVFISTESNDISIANIVFESLRDEVVAHGEDAALNFILEEAQLSYLLELDTLTSEQLVAVAAGVTRLLGKPEAKEAAPELLEHMTRVREFILTQGVNL